MSAVEVLERDDRRETRPPARPGPTPGEPGAASSDRVPVKTWLAVLGATLGSFMAILDIQIVNSSLADIQGAIGAGIDDGGWIATSYLVAEIVVIPLTAWLSQVFSVRNYLLVNSALFIAFSVLCGLAGNLTEMIVLRGLQGFTGGVLIPMAFSVTLTVLPRAKQPIGMALFAITATFAPAIGPTVGGWLNENYGWEFIFYVNVIPGLIMLALLWYSLPRQPMNLGLLKEVDWGGILTMAVGLAALQTMLEEGNKNDWFGSPFILRLAIVSAIALPLFVWIELRKQKPLVNLRILCRRNFGVGTMAIFLLGFALYGSVFILPLYLSQIQGYNAEQIGKVMAWYGFPQLAIIPFVPWLMKRVGARALVGFGFLIFAASSFINTGLSGDYSGPQFVWANAVRALGQAVLLAPLAAIATGGIEPEKAGSASALFNMMRNLGGAIGIAVLQTFLTKREQFHSNVLTQSVSLFREATRARLAELQQYFLSHGESDAGAAWHDAVVAIGRSVRHQAYIMGYSDTFFLLGIALTVALFASLLFKKDGQAGSVTAH